MRRWACLLCVWMIFAAGLRAQQKKRVAVLDFDYATVSTAAAAIFGTNVDVGKGVADLLVDDLVKSGVYSVIERKALDKVLAEQNFSNSNRADPSTAAQLGRVLGVDAIIIGSITQFGRDDKATKVGGGLLGGYGRKYGLGGIAKRESKAVVGITARLVSTETAEILAVAEGKGESNRAGTSLIGSGGADGAAGAAGYDMSSKNFASTILGEATYQAVQTLARGLDQNAGRMPARRITVEGLVADVSQNTLVLNVGTRAGVKPGDRLQIRRPIREIKDPASGKVIRRIEDKIGEAVVTEADENSSVASYTGASTAKVGDKVTSIP
jgi:curli biogenesis system outer membrane secretion channel CsgG